MLVKSESTSKLSSANVLSGSQFLLSNKMYFRGSYFRNILFALMICHTDCVVMKTFCWRHFTFSTITSPAVSSSNLSEDLIKMTQWACQWKMSFNPDRQNKHWKLFFLERKMMKSHPSLYFNKTRIQRQSVEKHLGLLLDEKLSFLEHIDEKNKGSSSRV